MWMGLLIWMEIGNVGVVADIDADADGAQDANAVGKVNGEVN